MLMWAKPSSSAIPWTAYFMLPAVGLESYDRLRPWIDACNRGAAPDIRAGLCGRREQHLLHSGMVETADRRSLWRCRPQVAVHELMWPQKHIEPWLLVTA